MSLPLPGKHRFAERGRCPHRKVANSLSLPRLKDALPVPGDRLPDPQNTSPARSILLVPLVSQIGTSRGTCPSNPLWSVCA
jgi:hypothetical protein